MARRIDWDRHRRRPLRDEPAPITAAQSSYLVRLGVPVGDQPTTAELAHLLIAAKVAERRMR